MLNITVGSALMYQCNRGSYAKPLCYASVILSLPVVVGESLANAKAAATGFERETRGNLSSLSFVVTP